MGKKCNHENEEIMGSVVVVGLLRNLSYSGDVVGGNQYQGRLIGITSDHITLNPGIRADQLAEGVGTVRAYYMQTQLPWVASFELGSGEDVVIARGDVGKVEHYTQGSPLERQPEFNEQVYCGEVNLERLFNPPTDEEKFKEAIAQHTREYQRLIEEGRDPEEIIQMSRKSLANLSTFPQSA